MVEASTASWEFWFGLLEAFKEREGHCRVPAQHKEDGFQLGTWVSTQRSRIEKLSAESCQRLDEIGFVWDPLTEAWEEGFSKLLQFKNRKGHCKVPTSHKEGSFALGTWVRVQRRNIEALSAGRRQRLDALGFVWDALTEAWEEGFSMLQRFKDREGDCMVPAIHKEGGYRLGVWVKNQRRAKDALPAERRQRLDDIGVVLDPLTEAWEEGFSALLQFKNRKGHCKVPTSHKEDGFNLGTWAKSQRAKKEAMSTERRQRLDDLGFVWAARKD